jgi:hypothetical protein
LRAYSYIPLKYEIKDVIRFCHLDRISDKIDDFENIVNEAYELIYPKAMYKTSEIEVKDDLLILENGTILKSKLLVEKFRCAQKVAIYIVTLGSELERRVAELGVKDLYRAFILDNIGTYALRQVFEYIKKDFEPGSSESISKFSPGSTKYWDIEQQEIIFNFLDKNRVKEVIGVILNDYYVMIPRKSISGVMGDTTDQFHECQICKKNCEYRKVPFSG